MAVTVTNLSTGEEKVYLDMHPENAVIVAYLQSRNNYNTWDYKRLCEEMRPNIRRGTHSIAYGDWCALLRPDSRITGQ